MAKPKFNKYGWKRDLPDHRDFKYVPPAHIAASLPPSVDLRPNMPPVYDQGSLGACTSHAIAGDLEYSMIHQERTPWTPSRLFIYYNERIIENSTSIDSGATLRDGIKSLVQWGFCKETTWSYDISKFAKKPVATAYKEAVTNKITQYSRISQDVDHMKACLASGDAFFFGFSVFESFESQSVAS